MTDANPGPGLIYRPHDTGIHEFVFTESNHAVVDQWLAQSEQSVRALAPDAPYLLLLNHQTSDTIPLMYAVERIQAMIRNEANPYPRTRVAILHPRHFMVSIISAFARLLPGEQTSVHFFPMEEREKAIAWLLEAEPPSE